MSEEVVHPFSFEALKRFESRMAVTNVLLTHEGMRSRILRTSTHESRRKHSPELILIEVHARCRHCQRMWTIAGTAGDYGHFFCVWVGTVDEGSPQGSARGQRIHRAGERTFGGSLTSPTDHEGGPYGRCHYTPFPLHFPLAREAPTPDAPVIPPQCQTVGFCAEAHAGPSGNNHRRG